MREEDGLGGKVWQGFLGEGASSQPRICMGEEGAVAQNRRRLILKRAVFRVSERGGREEAVSLTESPQLLGRLGREGRPAP